MSFGIAQTLNEVVDAWGIVYTAYRRNGLANPNPQHLHTAPQAISSDTAVIFGRIGGLMMTTLTAVADGKNGLPLDRIYGAELSRLRDQGRSLVEVSLFADRRSELAQTTESLFQLMRYAFFYAYWWHTDILIGVQPRHTRFYSRSIGFEILGAARDYPSVQGQSVVMMGLDIHKKLEADPLPVGLDYFHSNPVDKEIFDHRFDFKPGQFADSILDHYLQHIEAGPT